ncbi:hypothetical protein SAMN06265337_2927 [Hymenobacter gelipurpurascens]|uniref:DUF5777 domain-containing protein n=1 Tax=Hymenobacter gelipurpurascens TaxID=89968 RepID=A0A212UBW9_9BACT|nr:DUF5777 family beta-barrel protein [Hymenobacter gelipurpurascens]SNC75544.1 hypothetical protein SAMN06265337_2927 [Hymenobacter gelipurpurascens]
MPFTFPPCSGRLALLLSTLLALWSAPAQAQDDLLGQLESQAPKEAPAQVAATFKSTRLINGHTVETPGQGTMVFLISHRFGTLNSGAYNFFGLDQASIRLGLEYALTDQLEIGIGRSSLEKTLDGFAKYRAVRQSSGPGAMPISVTLFASSALTTLRYNDNVDYTVPRRLNFTYQALLARKFSSDLSLQLMPTLIHRNLVATKTDPNDVYAIGFGGRQKLSKRTSLNAEYYYLLPGSRPTGVRNALALGFDIETGGHVFQLHVTNSQGMIEKFFVANTRGNFFDGDIYFGFNVNRNFTVRPKEGFRK